MYSRLSSSYILCPYYFSSEMSQLLQTRICQMWKYRLSVHAFRLTNLILRGWSPGIYVGIFKIGDESDVSRGFCTKIRAWLINKSILHIYFYQTGKHICEKCLKNVAGENILHIYLYLTTRYICKKCLKFMADKYILHIYYEKIRINICNFV